MFFEGNNAFITFSYLIAALVFLAVIIWLFVDGSRQKKRLDQLERGSEHKPENGVGS
ncbi:MAG: heme exporter protein CcmD [Pseudomonadota bacterium]